MKMKRKLAGFSACALVLSSLTVPVAHAASVDFDDIGSHWAKGSIERWAGYEVVNGFGNNQFKPEDTMTRAQMAQILSKTLGLTATATTNPFTDVSDSDWFKDAILKCNAAGIMKGTSDTTANPNAQISRQDAVTMMGRALGIEADGDSTTFDDNGSIGSWAVGFVNAMSKRGIVNGRSEGVFAPTGDIKRGEITTILDRAITTYVNTPDTEVTATGKGITLIAAPGVTVKGEAEDILVAPAATGTTTLDGVKVSGAVTMQAADGTLVLGGNTTAAKLNIPALATGAKITIEKDATVAAMNSAADNVTVDGTGKITDMVVAGGKGVTVAGTVAVGKITNNGSDPVTHGTKTIAANSTSAAPVVGGGGGGGGSSSGGSSGGNTGAQTTVATDAQNFIDEAKKAQDTIDVKMPDGVTALGEDVKIENNTATTMTLDLNKATAGTFTVNAAKATSITIKGGNDSDDGQIAKLVLNAPNADVESEITIADAEIVAVADKSFHPKKPHRRINMKGKGKLDVKDPGMITEAVTVSVADDSDAKQVIISGYVPKLNVNSAVEVILDAIKDFLKVESNNSKSNITVEKKKADAEDNTIVMSGPIGTLTAKDDVKLNNATVTTAITEGEVEIAAATTADLEGTGETQQPSTVAELTAKDNVTVDGVDVTKLTPEKENSTVTVNNATVDSISTSVSVTIAGNEEGVVKSVDVDLTTDNAEDKVTITKDEGVKVEQVTAVGETEKGDITLDWGDEKAPDVLSKAQAPTGLTGAKSTVWGKGTISGVTDKMEYQEKTDAEPAEDGWTRITAEDIAEGSITVDSGKTYLVRVAETDGEGADKVLASDSVSVVVPAQVGVTSATITGTPEVGQTLTAAANEDADDVEMTYSWSDGTSEIGTAKELAVTEAMAGKEITVTISNYGGTDPATTKTSAAVTIAGTATPPPPAADTYTITFDTQVDGLTVASIEVESGTAATKPADPTRTDYTFDGWFKDAACTETEAFDWATLITADITLYAKWTEVTGEYTITLTQPTGATLSVNQTKADAEVTITVTATPDEGKKVTGITVTAADDTTITATAGATNTWTFEMPEQNVTVTATVEDDDSGNTGDYTIALAEGAEALVEVDKTTANENDTVTITARTNANVTDVTVKQTENNETVAVTAGESAGSWTFTMPAYNVTVTATGEVTTPPVTPATVDLTLLIAGDAKGDAAVAAVKQGTETITAAASGKYPVNKTDAIDVTLTIPATVTKEQITITGASETEPEVTVAAPAQDAETTTATFTISAITEATTVTITIGEPEAAKKAIFTIDSSATGLAVKDFATGEEADVVDNAIEATNGTVKFKVTGTATDGKILTVTYGNDNTAVTPDADGVYTISNITDNITVTIELVDDKGSALKIAIQNLLTQKCAGSALDVDSVEYTPVTEGSDATSATYTIKLKGSAVKYGIPQYYGTKQDGDDAPMFSPVHFNDGGTNTKGYTVVAMPIDSDINADSGKKIVIVQENAAAAELFSTDANNNGAGYENNDNKYYRIGMHDASDLTDKTYAFIFAKDATTPAASATISLYEVDSNATKPEASALPEADKLLVKYVFDATGVTFSESDSIPNGVTTSASDDSSEDDNSTDAGNQKQNTETEEKS